MSKIGDNFQSHNYKNFQKTPHNIESILKDSDFIKMAPHCI